MDKFDAQIKTREKTNKNILWLGASSFFNDVSTEMILPILPMFILSLGGSPFIVGLIGGLRKSIANLGNIFVGYWSDKTGHRKKFVFFGYTISSVCKFILAFSKQWPVALFFASLERTGKGLRRAPIDTIIAESAPNNVGLGFGIHRTFDTTGAAIGSLFTLIFLSFFKYSYKTIILIGSAIGLLSLIPLTRIKPTQSLLTTKSFFKSLKSQPTALRQFLIASSIFALAHFSYMFFLMKVHIVFSGNLSVIMPSFLYLISNSFYAAGSIPVGIMADTIGHNKIIMAGYLLFAITSIGFIYANTIPMFIILFMLYGIVKALIEGTQRAYTTSLANKSELATALGIFHTATGMFGLTANIIAGALWQYINPDTTFLFGSAISLTATLYFLSKLTENKRFLAKIAYSKKPDKLIYK